MRIALPILWNDDTDVILEDLGIGTKDLQNKQTKDCIFYKIDALLPYIDNDIEYTEIVCGHKSLICSLTSIEIDKLICNENN
jgi:hypothetical protein